DAEILCLGQPISDLNSFPDVVERRHAHRFRGEERDMVAGRSRADEGPADAAAAFDPPDLGDFARSTAAQDRLHDLVPGGAHTYARGSDQSPEGMAPVLARGRGARVWDLDGREYVEYGMGLRSVTLGHGHRAVTDAVARAITGGVSFSRPTAWELEAAE